MDLAVIVVFSFFRGFEMALIKNRKSTAERIRIAMQFSTNFRSRTYVQRATQALRLYIMSLKLGTYLSIEHTENPQPAFLYFIIHLLL